MRAAQSRAGRGTDSTLHACGASRRNVSVGDCLQGLPYDFAALCPTLAKGLPYDLAAFILVFLHVFFSCYTTLLIVWYIVFFCMFVRALFLFLRAKLQRAHPLQPGAYIPRVFLVFFVPYFHHYY